MAAVEGAVDAAVGGAADAVEQLLGDAQVAAADAVEEAVVGVQAHSLLAAQVGDPWRRSWPAPSPKR